MLVDDEPKVLRAFTRMLRSDGYTVETHDSGFGLTVAMRRFRPDVVLLDINMPGLNGDAAIRAATDLLDATPAPRLIVVSGIAENELSRRSQSLGACAYLVKPVGADALRHAVRQAIADVPSVGT